MTTETK